MKKDILKSEIKKRQKKFNVWDVEDPESAGMSNADIKKMWQELVDTGLAWKLQGWYGRTANSLIEQGIIRPARRKK